VHRQRREQLGSWRVVRITVLPNKEMKLTKPGKDGASQLISSVRWT
jgi:hypothetical protein